MDKTLADRVDEAEILYLKAMSAVIDLRDKMEEARVEVDFCGNMFIQLRVKLLEEKIERGTDECT